MTLKEQKRYAIAADVTARLMHGIEAVASELLQECLEVIDALAYACTFKNPRTLSGIYMTSDKFEALSNSLTMKELLEAAVALTKRNDLPPNKKLFYILSTLARIYGRGAALSIRQDFIQRRYTAKELNAVITKIEDLDKLDL